MTGSTDLARKTGVNITHLSLVSVPVADRRVAKAFYTEMLGFTVARELADGDQQWVELALHGTVPRITLVTWFPQMPPGSLQGLVFDTDDIAQAREALRARGVEISPIERDPWGEYARFSDPDGNGLVLRQQASAS
jgi:catechol 2,3-dioxygenase-like lactoylglutathione lyase family enzyme